MTTRPLGSLALLVVAALVVSGCSTHSESRASRVPIDAGNTETSPASIAGRHRVTTEARILRLRGALPEAKGPLAFLADDAGLRSGTVMLTQSQAEAVVRALTQSLGAEHDLDTTRKVSVISRHPSTSGAGVSLLRYPEDRGEPIVINGHSFMPHPGVTIDVAMIRPAPAGEFLQLKVVFDLVTIEGFTEFTGQSVSLLGASNPIQLPLPFYQPIFTAKPISADVRLAPGATVVFREDHQIVDPLLATDAVSSERAKRLVTETVFIFLTADLEPVQP